MNLKITLRTILDMFGVNNVEELTETQFRTIVLKYIVASLDTLSIRNEKFSGSRDVGTSRGDSL